ncbi:MAG: hypothetical protein JRI68_21540 [Deltaproteobacteria bacterium]|nr:hypothetical protein [Deltaproteobacteria bacterium]
MTHHPPLVRARLLLLVGRVVVVCTLLGVATPVWAGDKAAAESLFQDGKEAMKQGKYEQACGLFAASFDAEPSVGALLNLARCHQQRGMSASAWAVYKDAAAMAARSGQTEREEGARRYAEQLEPKLSRLTITVAAPPDGLEVTRDGTAVVAATYGKPLPVDPGDHQIVATAPGYESWTTTIAVGDGADQQTLSIPPLEPGAGDGPAVAGEGPSGLLIGGLAVTGVGAVALGVGIAFGVVGMNDTEDLEDRCGGDRSNCAIADWDSEVDDVRVKADVSTAMIVIGSAAVVGGVVMLLLSPGSEPGGDQGDTAVTFAPWVGPSDVGLGVNGRF